MRVTYRDLEAVCNRINDMTGSPKASWTKQADGKHKSNIGNYHLSGAYGGYALHRMVSDGGGVEDVLRSGHVPKRELYERMHAFIEGLYHAKERGHSA